MIKKLLLLVALVATTTFTYGQTLTNAVIPASAELGETITLSFDFETDGTKLANKVYCTLFQGTPGNNGAWTYGQQPLITPNATSGSVSITNFTIPADLDDTLDWFIRLTYTHADGTWYHTPFEQAIDLTPSSGDSFSFDPNTPTYLANTSLDVNIKYSSNTEIPANGIKITYWTVIDETWCDSWRGQAFNTNALPAGQNMTATLTIGNFDAAISVNGVIMTTDEINTNQVNSPKVCYTNGVHFWQLRILDNDIDDDFAPGANIETNFTVNPDPTAGVKNYELKKIGVYPNPTTGLISVSEGDSEVKSVRIFNVLGKEVLKSDKATNIDVSGLSKGIYLLKTNNGRLSKFLKE